MTKLNRSETVTVRLDPRLNYLTEIAGRVQRRTKSSTRWRSGAHPVTVPLREPWNEVVSVFHNLCGRRTTYRPCCCAFCLATRLTCHRSAK